MVKYPLTDEAMRALRAEVERLRGIQPELPPMPPEGVGLPRYGLRWNGPDKPLAVPMADGYWTPCHLAVAQADALRSEVAAWKATAIKAGARLECEPDAEGTVGK